MVTIATRPLSEVRVGWLGYLAEAGYRESTITAHRLLFTTVQRHLDGQSLRLADLTPELAAQLRRDLGAKAEGLNVLLRFLRDQQLIPAATAPPESALLAAFTAHLHDLRGLSSLTARTRCDVIRRFLRHVQGRPIEELAPEHIHAFVRHEGERLASTSMAPVLDALRPHFEGSELSETFDRNCDRILALAAANDALDSPDGPADTPVHLPEDGRGGASGHSA